MQSDTKRKLVNLVLWAVLSANIIYSGWTIFLSGGLLAIISFVFAIFLVGVYFYYRGKDLAYQIYSRRLEKLHLKITENEAGVQYIKQTTNQLTELFREMENTITKKNEGPLDAADKELNVVEAAQGLQRAIMDLRKDIDEFTQEQFAMAQANVTEINELRSKLARWGGGKLPREEEVKRIAWLFLAEELMLYRKRA